MRRAVLSWTACLWALCVLGAAQEDPVAALQKRVQEVAKKVSGAFVFLTGGSGILISSDGWFLTNHHVIAPPNPRAPRDIPATHSVMLCDGNPRIARIVCTDPQGDIALLKIDGTQDLPYVEFGDSDKLEVGLYVIAIGNPWGVGSIPAADNRLYPAASLGIVSALHRFQDLYSDCIQTDAAVNPGNSGGPLVDLGGRLVGINGRIMTRFGNRTNSGVGLAVPVNQVKNFLPLMKKGGDERRVFHGAVEGVQISREHTQGAGAKVTGVRIDSHAGEAGLEEGDFIVAVNGKRVFSWRRFYGLIHTFPADSEVTITVRRGDGTKDLRVELDRATGLPGMAQRPPRPPEKPPERREPRVQFGATWGEVEDGSVRVDYVVPASPADEAGLRVGDRIYEVDGRDMTRREIILEALARKKPGDKLRLKVRRDQRELEIEVTLTRMEE
ncbi:MAG: PDZ domain-containing protein [Planctomycetes bacterium]|nr:PDZ domain-containing protein [Planctomycetota bacterium]